MSLKKRVLAWVAAITITATSMGYTCDTSSTKYNNTTGQVMIANAASEETRDYKTQSWDNNYYTHELEILRKEVDDHDVSYAGVDYIDLAKITVSHKKQAEDGEWFETETVEDEAETKYVWLWTPNPKSSDSMSGITDTRTVLDLSSTTFNTLPKTVTIEDGENPVTVKIDGTGISGIYGSLSDVFPYLKEIKLSTNVKYIGDNVFSNLQYITEIELPSSLVSIGNGAFSGSGVKSVKFNGTITAIPDNCFADTKLSEITLKNPTFIEYIGESAFSNTVLTEVPFTTTNKLVIGNNSFSGCTQLSKIDLPYNTVAIGSGAFKECTAAKSVSLPENVRYIGSYAFSDMASLTQVTGGKNLEIIGDGAFENNTSMVSAPSLSSAENLNIIYSPSYYSVSEDAIPSITTRRRVIEELGEEISSRYMFSGCSALKGVSLPSGIKAIPEGMFSDCISLTGLNAGSNAKTIGANAFSGCRNLQDISTSKEADTVESGAFQGCESLRSISFNTIDTLGDNAYQGCITLKSVDITVGSYIGDSVFSDCTGLTDVSIKTGSSGFTWGSYILSGCTQLKTASLDLENANFIPTGMFAGDIRLTSLKYTKLDNIELVLADAFNGCESLESLKLPKAIIVEDSAFKNCINLKQICSGDITIKDYGSNSFENCSSLTQKVNAGVSTIGENAFTNSAITEVNITSTDGNTLVIDNNAFANCDSLRTVNINIPDGVEYKIGSGIFENDSNLVSATYNGTEIPEQMFKDCTNLEKLSLPRAIDVLEGAFENCTKLQTITGVKAFGSIRNGAFKDCSTLQNTYADNKTTFYGEGQYEGCTGLKEANVYYLTNNMFRNCSGLEKVNLSGNITILPENAFLGCSKLSNINLDKVKDYEENCLSNTGIESLTLSSANTIGNGSFSNCANLKTVDIEIDDIANEAFENCTSLTTANITANRIESKAFSGCSSLRDMKFILANGYSLIEIGEDAFSETMIDHVVIPDTVTYIGDGAFGYAGYGKKEDFIIYGKAKSEANTYADNNEFTFKETKYYNEADILKKRKKLGDVNMDGVISVADAVLLQKWLLADEQGSVGVYGPNMDLNEDGQVDCFDMVFMRKKLVESQDF